jgi:hypothetical protein
VPAVKKQEEEPISLGIDRQSTRSEFESAPSNCSRDVLREVIGRNVMAWIGAEVDKNRAEGALLLGAVDSPAWSAKFD